MYPLPLCWHGFDKHTSSLTCQITHGTTLRPRFLVSRQTACMQKQQSQRSQLLHSAVRKRTGQATKKKTSDGHWPQRPCAQGRTYANQE